MTESLSTVLHQAIRRTIPSGSPVVAAVSGGPDSVALALGLAILQRTEDLEVHFAHFDHGLRRDSADDALFVSQLAEKLGFPYTIGRDDVAAKARIGKLGIEESARYARYRFLGDVGRSIHAVAILTGHTADDQTETRLLHLVRGSGLRGLVGMVEDSLLPVPASEPVRVVRPLLGVSRAATEAFCRAHGVTPRIDPTNADPSYSRNRLRLQVIPSLRALNPRLDNSLERLARTAHDTEEFVESELDRRFPDVVVDDGEIWHIRRSAWRSLPTALKRALLRRAADRFSIGEGVLDAEHVERSIRAADSWTAGKQLIWPGGCELRVEHDTIRFSQQATHDQPLPTQSISIEKDECLAIGHLPPSLMGNEGNSRKQSYELLVCQRVDPCTARRTDAWHIDLDVNRLQSAGPLTIRPRQPGDWLLPQGMTGRKKLQDVLVDAHIPGSDRDHVPVVASTAGLVWVVGLRRDRRFLADVSSKHVLCLSVEPGSDESPRSWE